MSTMSTQLIIKNKHVQGDTDGTFGRKDHI